MRAKRALVPAQKGAKKRLRYMVPSWCAYVTVTTQNAACDSECLSRSSTKLPIAVLERIIDADASGLPTGAVEAYLPW
jgi:hypothetical protein